VKRLPWAVTAMSTESRPRGSRRTSKRTYNTRLIKRDYSYLVCEIADLFHLHSNAVRRWIKTGLLSLDDRRPILVHGGDLIDFLDGRQARRKQKCAIDELYCFLCRCPRHPRLGRVEFKIRNETTLNISGVCDTCGTRMNRAGSVARIAEYRQAFNSRSPGEGRLTGRSDPTIMCHSTEKSHA
jgi:hypothetical protein